MSTSETIIIKNCQTGDLSEFGEIYDTYIKKIYNYVYYRTHHRETAEDLTSTAFTKALENINKFNPDKGTFSAWLYKITKNLLCDHYKKYKKLANIDDIWDLSDKDDVERDADTKFKLEKIQKYMKTLKPQYREIIIMRVWDGLSYREISEILGKKEGNCKVLFSRAISKIRDDGALASILLVPLILNL